MRLSHAVLLAGLLLSPAIPAVADTTYTYTGNGFTQLDSGTSYTSSSSITGSITFASPLDPDLGNQFMAGFVFASPITYLSFSFSDGLQTITNATAVNPIINIATDDQGNIIAWQIDVGDFAGNYEIFFNSHTILYTASGNDGATFNGIYGGNSTPGTWSLVGGSQPVLAPEPSSLAFLITGVVGVAGAARKRLRKARTDCKFFHATGSAFDHY